VGIYSAIMRVTGLSISACSRVRSGQLIPHRRGWSLLFIIVDAWDRLFR
jgi:hypothetical protein